MTLAPDRWLWRRSCERPQNVLNWRIASCVTERTRYIPLGVVMMMIVVTTVPLIWVQHLLSHLIHFQCLDQGRTHWKMPEPEHWVWGKYELVTEMPPWYETYPDISCASMDSICGCRILLLGRPDLEAFDLHHRIQMTFLQGRSNSLTPTWEPSEPSESIVQQRKHGFHQRNIGNFALMWHSRHIWQGTNRHGSLRIKETLVFGPNFLCTLMHWLHIGSQHGHDTTQSNLQWWWISRCHLGILHHPF